MGYNSLVWIKDPATNSMIFDPDTSNITPGFRFGFPVIEPSYYDADKSVWAFMMVSPSGGRTQFRQTSAGGVYDTADSSYTRLTVRGGAGPNDPVEDITLTVAGTDGTKMYFEWKAGAYRCTQIKDRNGNIITMTYHPDFGVLETVTDTLGREINVNYDGDQYPISITQNWKANNGVGTTTPHPWATFSYSNKQVATNFSTTNVYGPPNGTQVKVLERVTYADGSNTRFEYNGYLQVHKVRNFAADSHELNYVRTNLDSVSGGQDDCPRFTRTFSKVENFNNGTEVEVTNSVPADATYSLPDGTTGAAKFVDVALVGHPTPGFFSRTWIEPTGWKEGLTVATEDCVGGCTGADKKRWTHTAWTQDNTSVSYIVNPRVTETRVGDGVNMKRTTVEYYTTPNTTLQPYGLPERVRVFSGTAAIPVKESVTTYNLANAYVNRRIIGLPAMTQTWGKNDETNLLEYVSKVTYGYDEEGFNIEPNQNIPNVIRHDNTAYSANFVVGRGNLTTTTRRDVTGATLSVVNKLRYDIAGSVVAKLDPLTRKIAIDYADVYNDTTISRNTYAYPTKLTDPTGNYSQVKYRFDIGANVWAKSPNLNSTTAGKETTREYDAIGRTLKETVVNNGAYTRYEYPTNGIQSKSFSTIVDTNSNGADASDEVLSESWTDGAGRVRRSRTLHPGSTGGWAGSLTEYNILGQAWRSTVPTEIAVPNENNPDTWYPTGDDYRGMYGSNYIWLWNRQEFDWKGRPERIIPSDSDGEDGKDTIIAYEGCGCAGGQITTVHGPEVPRDDEPETNARRKQMIHEDILGRAWKSVSYKWNGSSPYLRTETQFNGRDQAISVVQTDEEASVSQTTSMTYDGHGRLASKHIPQQDANKSTTYNYNPDDSIHKIWDARGVSTNYTYNSRGLVQEISHTVPTTQTDLAGTPTTTFSYDNLGNRTQMTDGLGSVSYIYNSLSQMTSETRQFNDDIPDAPQPNDSFRIEYTYHLGGQLKTLKEPFGVEVNYALDKTGRLTGVAPTVPIGGATWFAANASYRAWGALKHLAYGNGMVMVQTFDNKLQTATHQAGTSTVNVLHKSYEYYKDGSLKFVDDQVNGKFDRLNRYDHQGRIAAGKSSAEASGGTVPPYDEDEQLPYRQTYAYTAFGNMKTRNNLHWGTGGMDTAYQFVNDRVTGAYAYQQWEYDADGRIKVAKHPEPTSEMTYDAAGRMIEKREITEPDVSGSGVEMSYSGDGRETRRRRLYCIQNDPEANCQWSWEGYHYYIRSSVLGGEVVSESSGNSYVLAGGTKLATVGWANVLYHHTDASGMSIRATHQVGTITTGAQYDPNNAELDSGNTNVGLITPYEPPSSPPLEPPAPMESAFYINGLRATITLDGTALNGQHATAYINSGMVGGMMGLTQILMSQNDWRLSHFSVGKYNMYPTLRGAEAAIGEAIEMGLPIIRNFIGGNVSIAGVSWAPEIQQEYRRATEREIKILKETTTKAANNTDLCRKYIKDLLEMVKANNPGSELISTNVESLFDAIDNSRWPSDPKRGGILFTGGQESGAGDGGEILIALQGAFSVASPRGGGLSGHYLTTGSFLSQLTTGMTTIHELMHAAFTKGNSEDKEFAYAAARLAGEDRPKFAEGDSGRYAASRYWGDRLNQACGFPSSIDKKYTKHQLYKP